MIRLSLLGTSALLLLILLAVLYIAIHQFRYNGLIYPSISSFGVKLDGLTKQRAVEALSARYTYSKDAIFTFRDRQKAWQISAVELGVSFDPTATIDEAYKVGRSGEILFNVTSQGDAWLGSG